MGKQILHTLSTPATLEKSCPQSPQQHQAAALPRRRKGKYKKHKSKDWKDKDSERETRTCYNCNRAGYLAANCWRAKEGEDVGEDGKTNPAHAVDTRDAGDIMPTITTATPSCSLANDDDEQLVMTMIASTEDAGRSRSRRCCWTAEQWCKGRLARHTGWKEAVTHVLARVHN